jgi:hypothetical protein
MTKYRIRKEDDGFICIYTPQIRFLGIWYNPTDYKRSYVSYDDAKKALIWFTRKPKVEFLEVNVEDT